MTHPVSSEHKRRPHDTDVDQALLAAGRGDHQAFERFYDATAARSYGLVLRVLRDRSQSEEVLQEVYVEVWQRAASFNPSLGPAIPALLLRAHRRAVDRVRSAQMQTVRDDAFHSRGNNSELDPTAEDAMDGVEAGRVRTALGELSDDQRQAIVLAFLDGLSHREVAERLEIPLGTAKTRIRDGMLTLRRKLVTNR